MLSMLASLIVALIDLYSLFLVVYVVMSWIPRGRFVWVESLREVLAGLCEPFLGFFRRTLPPLGMIDFSPVVAILALDLIAVVITAIL